MRLPRPSVANASARRTDVLALGEAADRHERGPLGRPSAAGRRSAEALEVDARVDHDRLPARLGQLQLELAAEVVGDRDHRRSRADDAARVSARDAGNRADVAHVAAVGGDDERRVDRRRDQPRRDEEVRPDDVGPRRRAHLAPQLEEAPLAAAAPVEHRELDLVPALAERQLQLRDEDAEVGVVGPRVHLRDEQDPQARS